MGELRFGDPLGIAMGKLEDRFTSDEYTDFHAWKFTPASFELMLLETAALDLCDWRIEHITEAVGCEFHVRLRRGGAQAARAMSAPEIDARRMMLLRRTLDETREQLDWASAQPREILADRSATAYDESDAEGGPPTVPLPLGYRLAKRASRLAVILHLYHADMNAEFRTVIEQIEVPFDLVISTTDVTRADTIRAIFRGWRRGNVSVRVFPNRGRDIAAKLVGFRDVYADYEIVLFLHSKKSAHSIALDG